MKDIPVNELRAAFDAQLRGVTPPGGSARIERDGPLTRVVGWRRGFVTGPRDLGVYGAELDVLIARQRDFYVDASADSAPILTRLGLHAVTTTTPYVWSP